ncbi:hypothetical protein HDU96_009201, partial [Phlyctochytrium bullatum]
MGRTALLAKALQKYAQKTLDGTKSSAVAGTPALSISRAESPMPTQSEKIGSGAPSLSAHSLGTLASGKRRKSVSSAARSSIRPVIVARVAGLTPTSSTAFALMSSITQQICAAYNVAVDDDDEINIDVFRESLRLATSERPLIIAVAKIDRLCDGQGVAPTLSWLTDCLPPYVRVILTAREGDENSAASFIQNRILLAIPSIITSLSKATTMVQPEPDVADVLDQAYGLFVTGYIVVWDLETGSILKHIPPDEEENELFSYGAACASSDGRYLLIGSKTLRLLQSSSKVTFWSQTLFARKVTELALHRVTQVRFADDNSSFYVVSALGNRDDMSTDSKADLEWRGILQRWEFQTRTSRILARLSTAVTSMSISPDNRIVALGGEDGSVQIFNSFTGTRIAVEAYAHFVSSLAFSPPVSSSYIPPQEDVVYAYRRRSPWTGASNPKLDGAEEGVPESNNVYRLCVGSVDGIIRVLSLSNEPEKCSQTAVSAARISSCGRYFLVAGGGDEDNFSLLPPCFMLGQRNDSKSGAMRGRLASTTYIHKQEGLELINDLVLGASKMRNKSEAAWEVSNLSLAAAKSIRSISTINRDDLEQEKQKKTKSVSELSSSVKALNSGVADAAAESAPDRSAKTDDVVHMSTYELATKPVATTLLSLYDVATARLICSFVTRGDVIWCDFDYNQDGSIRAIITGDRSGLLRFWCVGRLISLKNGSLDLPEKTVNDVPIETFETRLADGVGDNVVGYSLNRTTSMLAMTVTVDPSDVKSSSLKISTVNQTSTGLLTYVEFWDFDTFAKVDHLTVSVDALPCILGGSPNPLLSLSWGIPSEEISRLSSAKFSAINMSPFPPCSLVVGPSRLFVRTDVDTQRSLPITSVVDDMIGPDAAARCTASAQSVDPHVVLLGFGDLVLWICEERFPVVRADAGDLNTIAAMGWPRQSLGAADTSKPENVIDVKSEVEVAKQSSPEEPLEQNTAAPPEGPLDVNPESVPIVHVPIQTHNTPDSPAEHEPAPTNPSSLLTAQSPSDYCRVRRLRSVPGESAIALHHLKSGPVDAVLVATDAGTVAVYDLNTLSSAHPTVGQEDDEFPVLAIWHARTPLLGMQAVE